MIRQLRKEQIKVTLLTGIFYFTYYMGRYNYAAAIPFIQEAFGVNNIQLGMIATTLTAAYAIGQLINGFLIDRFGPRNIMSYGGILSVFANLSAAASSSFTGLLTSWGFNGYFQAMGYGSVCKLYANWFKKEERGTPLGFNEFLQSFSSTIIVPLGAFIITWLNWRYSFIIPVIPLFVMSFIFFFSIKDKPQDLGFTAVYEVDKPPRPQDAYRAALSDWRMIASYVSYGGSQFGRFVIYSWVAKYIYEMTGNIITAGWVTAAFALGGSAGSLVVGWLSDRFKLRYPIICLGMMVSAVSLIVFAVSPNASPLILSVLLAICGSGIEAVEVCYFLLPLDILEEDGYQATGVGVMNSFGKAFATVQGVLFGFLLDVSSFQTAFLVTAGVCVLSALLVIPIKK